MWRNNSFGLFSISSMALVDYLVVSDSKYEEVMTRAIYCFDGCVT
jgi:hypothetical protein